MAFHRNLEKPWLESVSRESCRTWFLNTIDWRWSKKASAVPSRSTFGFVREQGKTLGWSGHPREWVAVSPRIEIMNDPEKTDVGNDPKTCIRAYHLVDDVGVIEHLRDQVSFDQPLQNKGHPLGWSSKARLLLWVLASGWPIGKWWNWRGRHHWWPNGQRGDRHERTDAVTKCLSGMAVRR